MRKGKDRITVRLSESDLKGLSKIQSSGDFTEISEAVRWCIHFSVALMRLIPIAILNSFVDTEVEEVKPDDTMEVTPEEVREP
uniref:Uncharacterized protein n=1 Tax=viral metagenome TaxID=1070528 RepID=A0A6H1ZHZ3_9ZZZZ